MGFGKESDTVGVELPQIVQTVQRRLPKVENKILSNKLISFFKRSQFCFSLNTVIVVEVNVFGYDEASLIISGKLNSVNAFRFEY